ncbi:oligopeptide/dipeptide ABC transporter ATP-binding protein [Pectinatus haikarae]|uniref:oligopeptide/dipeptide ABC transporter ATP-binding protein n=1 Tax=Pectinatus haikarae TaxID=349096 RepID=UPI0018C5F864|nr:ABC transporter ATP-binding protein [Pectinatus haikarae]
MKDIQITSDFCVDHLCVAFPNSMKSANVLSDINVVFRHGIAAAVIGESGCGKSVLVLALLGLLPKYASVHGHIFYNSFDVLSVPFAIIQSNLSKHWGIIPQSPSDALNPIRKIKKQFDDIGKNASRGNFSVEELCDSLTSLGLSDIERILQSYPHELSGGMLQRILFAMAVCCEPEWVFADEPTKGLDEQSRQQVSHNLLHLKTKKTQSMILITHDLPLTEEICEVVVVMYAGEIMEITNSVYTNGLHPYTRALIAALPINGFNPIPDGPVKNGSSRQCRFAPHCAYASKQCKHSHPNLYSVDDMHKVRCFLYA